MEWIERLNQSVQYIENNLEGKVDYNEAARIAYCSTFHFQRMFSYIAGVTLAEYIRRRRMTKAAFELQNSDITIIELAEKYGYDSPTSFNRAFQGIHSIPPSSARKKEIPLKAYTKLTFSITVKGDTEMQYHIADKGEIRVVGIRKKLQMDIEQNFQIAPEFWEEAQIDGLIHQICSLLNQSPDGILGVTVYENPEDFYYYIAVATDMPAPEGMYEYIIPSATWAIFDCMGPMPFAMQELFRRFCTEWLPFSGYEYAGQPDIEVYPIMDVKTTQAELWLSVKKPNNKM